VGWGGRLFEAGSLLTFSVFRVGAYSRRALIRINTVNHLTREYSCRHKMRLLALLGTFRDHSDRFSYPFIHFR